MRGFALAMGVLMFSWSARAEIRPPAVAGAFYPGERGQLEADVKRFLAGGAGGPQPIAVIVPHAGYVFSGATAGKVLAGLQGAKLKRVILLGPSHHASFRGGALPAATLTAFATPLGALPLDREAIEKLRASSVFGGPAEAHGPEHSIEVELPFLQVAVGNVPIVPILVGHATDGETAQEMARELAEILSPDTAVVISSDFTHHGPSYGFSPFPRNRTLGNQLIELGRATAGRAAALDARGFSEQVEVSGDSVCGARPITVLLELLDHAFAGAGRVVDVTTSAGVSDNWNQVVAYAGVAFTGAWKGWHEAATPPVLGTLDRAEEKAAVALARATLQTYLNHGPELARWFADHRVTGNLEAHAGVFVTIHNEGEKAQSEGRLRGCIGVIEAREPLVDAIVHAAMSAAHDPRFPELESEELAKVSVEVSVLSPLKTVSGPEAISLGKHGVVLTKGGHRALFLPQVATETGWDVPTFLSHLANKAGLPSDAWREGARLEVFTAQVFSETP